MRTIPAPLAAALTARVRRGAECLLLRARDGSVAGLTTWDQPLTRDLGTGLGDTVFSVGMTLSAVTLSAGFDTSNFEVEGAARGDFAATKVRGGKWRKADAWLVRVSPGVAGFSPIMRGTVEASRVEGSRFVFEVRNAMEAFQQTWGRVLSGICSAEFGDAQCGVARTPVAATVSAAGDGFRFTVDIGGDHPDDWFNLGTASFLTGDLAGTAEARIFDYDGASGAIELYEPLIAAPQVGDTLTLYRGCSRLLKSDDASLPTCLSYANVLNFRGFPEVPGSRQYHRVSAPGVSYA